mgnify:CR=1 FL=1
MIWITTMTDWAGVSRNLVTALELSKPPVAVTFSDTAPTDASAPSSAVPAGCSFWALGTSAALATEAKHHQHCSIGVHTHNLTGAPPSQSRELETALGAMQGLDYVRPEEVVALPVMKRTYRYVDYRPLREASGQPSVVLLFASAAQGLIITEALSRVDGATPMVMGRPACALIPQVSNSGSAASSLGCCGARAYIDMLSDDIGLWALPGDKLETYASEITTLANANTMLRQFHQSRRRAIESGESPSIEETLATLS